MKTMVVYFSLNGNSEYVAQAVKKELGADLLKLETVKTYPKNSAALYLVGGRSALMGEKPKLKAYEFIEAEYDSVIIISPNWADHYVPAINTFLSEHSLEGKRIGFIMCSKGGTGDKFFNKLYETYGKEKLVKTLSLIEPFRLKKDEDLVEIKNFCKAFV